MKEIIAQTAGRLVEEIFKTIEKVGMSNVGKTAEELFAVLKNGTLEVLAAAIGEMDAAVLSAKKEPVLFRTRGHHIFCHPIRFFEHQMFCQARCHIQ